MEGISWLVCLNHNRLLSEWGSIPFTWFSVRYRRGRTYSLDKLPSEWERPTEYMVQNTYLTRLNMEELLSSVYLRRALACLPPLRPPFSTYLLGSLRLVATIIQSSPNAQPYQLTLLFLQNPRRPGLQWLDGPRPIHKCICIAFIQIPELHSYWYNLATGAGRSFFPMASANLSKKGSIIALCQKIPNPRQGPDLHGY